MNDCVSFKRLGKRSKVHKTNIVKRETKEKLLS